MAMAKENQSFLYVHCIRMSNCIHRNGVCVCERASFSGREYVSKRVDCVLRLVRFAINVYNNDNMYKLLFEICFAAFADESKHLFLLLKIVQPRALIKLHEERVKASNGDSGLGENKKINGGRESKVRG